MTDADSGSDGTDDGAESAALVGAAGGVGTTRLTVELGAMLARDGRRVAAFDAAFATQGMVDYVDGRVDPDATALLTDESVTPAAAMVECELAGNVDGELHLCPARAPFGDLARAKTPEAARRLETALREAADRFDRVLVDVPPVASNPAVAAVTAVDRVALVGSADPRGVDAVQRMRGRLEDVGASGHPDEGAGGNSGVEAVDLVVANRGDADGLSADVAVPEGPPTTADAPVADRADSEFGTGIATLAERLFGVELGVEFETGGVLDRIR